MTGFVFSLIGIVIGVALTATFNLLMDLRRARTAALPVRRLVLHELVVGRDALVGMLASRTLRQVGTSFERWEELRPQFAGVASEKEWKLVTTAFALLEVVETVTSRQLEAVDGPTTDWWLEAVGAEIEQEGRLSESISWIRAIKDPVEQAVAILGGPPADTSAAQEVEEIARRSQQKAERARQEQERSRRELEELVERDVRRFIEEHGEGLDPEDRQKLEEQVREHMRRKVLEYVRSQWSRRTDGGGESRT